jgi:glucose-6-phosphate 1-dehydrogenase
MVGPEEAYERLIHDVLLGDQSLFVREDVGEQAWRIVQPLLDEPRPGASTRPAHGARTKRNNCWRHITGASGRAAHPERDDDRRAPASHRGAERLMEGP